MKWLSCLFIFSVLAIAQPPQRIIYVTSDSSGACSDAAALQWNATSGNLSACASSVWTVIGTSSGAGGTVTSVTFAGTANEITATGTCTGTTVITCTISIPAAFILPGTIDGLTITTTTGTFTLANAKTLTVSNTMTFTATDTSTVAFGAGGTVLYTTSSAGSFPILNQNTSGTAADLASYPTLCNGTTQFSVGLSSGSNNCTNIPASTTTIANGTSTLGTSLITSGSCATTVTTTATGVTTTDAIIVSVNADPTSITGYAPLSTGSLYIWAYPTSGDVNFRVCNNTSSSITPSAITLNWRVVR